jgi:hypothetical protein
MLRGGREAELQQLIHPQTPMGYQQLQSAKNQSLNSQEHQRVAAMLQALGAKD